MLPQASLRVYPDVFVGINASTRAVTQGHTHDLGYLPRRPDRTRCNASQIPKLQRICVVLPLGLPSAASVRRQPARGRMPTGHCFTLIAVRRLVLSLTSQRQKIWEDRKCRSAINGSKWAMELLSKPRTCFWLPLSGLARGIRSWPLRKKGMPKHTKVSAQLQVSGKALWLTGSKET